VIGIDKASKYISEKISVELNLNSDEREILYYGAFSLIQTIISIVLVSVVSILFGVLVEALIVTFVVALLRKYSGGVHASTPIGCNIIGIFVCIVQAVVFSHIYLLFNVPWIIAIGMVIFIWSYIIIYKLAPVGSPAKPVKKETKIRRLKKASILIVSIYLVICMLNMYIYIDTAEARYLIYSLCIYGGVLWQAFTLTSVGHMLIGKLDVFLNQIFKLKERKQL
jgi:accessory gene regulator B